jgi:FkbM family methyltransferase
MKSVADLFDDISFSDHRGCEGPLLVYGAGNTGKAVTKYLSSYGLQICAFVDNNSLQNMECEGYSVLSLDQAFNRFGSDISVLIAVHNRGVNMVELIQTIKEAGFIHLYSMFDYARIFQSDTTFRYFLTDPSRLTAEKNNAQKFYELLSDDLSKKIYRDLIKFRLSGDYSFCPKPCLGNQYSPTDIPRWKSPLRLIDCGAYNGDSIRLFKSYDYEIESVIAFEPDLSNFHELIKSIDCKDVIFLPCGVSDTAKTIRFHSSASEGSRASSEGDITIQTISIDESFPGIAPNLIKMDIEGGEREAILGASATIKKFKPGLAVSAYHLPADLWQLGLLISDIQPDYHFFMRSHGYSSFETVLYAVPK